MEKGLYQNISNQRVQVELVGYQGSVYVDPGHTLDLNVVEVHKDELERISQFFTKVQNTATPVVDKKNSEQERLETFKKEVEGVTNELRSNRKTRTR
jgi:hypothetical protein